MGYTTSSSPSIRRLQVQDQLVVLVLEILVHGGQLLHLLCQVWTPSVLSGFRSWKWFLSKCDLGLPWYYRSPQPSGVSGASQCYPAPSSCSSAAAPPLSTVVAASCSQLQVGRSPAQSVDKVIFDGSFSIERDFRITFNRFSMSFLRWLSIDLKLLLFCERSLQEAKIEQFTCVRLSLKRQQSGQSAC